MKFRMRTFLVTAAVGLLFNVSVYAKDPDGTVLKVTGKIGVTNTADKKAYVFSFADLKQLGEVKVQATTTYAGKVVYSGPLMRKIMEVVKVQPGAKEVLAIGLDGYQVRVPLKDFEQWEVIAANTANGVRMTLETKGPLWLMYPLDANAGALANKVTDVKMVWNLVALKVQ